MFIKCSALLDLGMDFFERGAPQLFQKNPYIKPATPDVHRETIASQNFQTAKL